MQISSEILKKFNLLKEGKVYYGEFAKDSSFHAAVVITMYKDRLNCFCITSSKSYIDSVSKIDKSAVVSVPKSLVDRIFTEQQKDSWIYCGKANLKTINKNDFLALLSKNKISFKDEVPEEFLAQLKIAVKSSITYSKQMLSELGF